MCEHQGIMCVHVFVHTAVLLLQHQELMQNHICFDIGALQYHTSVCVCVQVKDVSMRQVLLPDREFEASRYNVCSCVTGERMYAHGGIVAAAAAILADMEQHHLLRRLLEEYDPFDQQRQQPSHRSDNPKGGRGGGGLLQVIGLHAQGHQCHLSVHVLYSRLQRLMHASFTCTHPDAIIIGLIWPGYLC